MNTKPQESIMVSIPSEFKDMLHMIATKRVLDNPKDRSTAAGLAREIVLEHLRGISKPEQGGQ